MPISCLSLLTEWMKMNVVVEVLHRATRFVPLNQTCPPPVLKGRWSACFLCFPTPTHPDPNGQLISKLWGSLIMILTVWIRCVGRARERETGRTAALEDRVLTPLRILMQLMDELINLWWWSWLIGVSANARYQSPRSRNPNQLKSDSFLWPIFQQSFQLIHFGGGQKQKFLPFFAMIVSSQNNLDWGLR